MTTSILVGTMMSHVNSSPIADDAFENHVGLLPATNDEHGGVIVEMEEAMDCEIFADLLKASMSYWTRQGKKGVWIKLPIQLANLIETTVKEGFKYHHAEPDYLMLVYWIPKTKSLIPPNATHRVRVGALVLKDDKEVLVVQEKSGRFRGTGVWKIPTGVVEEGEDIFEAVVREVKEETGIDTKFMEILAFRQSLKSFFSKSDLFFLCILHPQSFDIQKQELEIEAAQWMPFEDYAAQPFHQNHGLSKYITDLCLAKQGGDYIGFSPRPITSYFNDQPCYMYLNSQFQN
ncbi:hypothetical protein UlMin_003859 [Ulmus minor]